MPTRYRAALALTLALLLTGASPPRARTQAHPRVRHDAVTTAADLYSPRALRRAKIVLELELLELRSEHLERVRRAIEKHIPIDDLLKI